MSNSSVFHLGYRELNEDEKTFMSRVEEKASELYDLIESGLFPPGREVALARTKIDEAVMWTIKGITKNIIMKQEAFSFDKETLKKIGKGALIAGGGGRYRCRAPIRSGV